MFQGSRIRTYDHLYPKQIRYQLRYTLDILDCLCWLDHIMVMFWTANPTMTVQIRLQPSTADIT